MAVILKIMILKNLPIVYKQSMFTERPINHLIDNKVEMLKDSLIEQLLDNRRYKINPRNIDFDYLPFNGEGLTDRQLLYCINDNIVFR